MSSEAIRISTTNISGRNRPDIKSAAPLPFVLKLVILTLFLPEGLSVFVMDARLTPIRLVFICLVPILMVRFGRQLSLGRWPVLASDILVILTGTWMLLAVAVVAGAAELAHVIPEILEFCCAYFCARTFLTRHGHATAFVSWVCYIIAIVGVIGLLDNITSEYFTHDLVGSITGYVKVRQHDFRRGILRAASTLEHPIHLGIVSAFGLLLAVTLRIKGRLIVILSCCAALTASLSSAPILSVVMGLLLLTFNWVFKRFTHRWSVLIATVALALLILSFFVNSPIHLITEYLIFDASSGWYRLWVWQLASAAISESPWFGTAYAWRKIFDEMGYLPTVDSLWLLQALEYGIPASILLALAMISSTFLPTRGARVQLSQEESNLGTTLGILLFLIMFLGFTVHMWAAIWVFLGLIVGLRAHLGALGRQRYLAF